MKTRLILFVTLLSICLSGQAQYRSPYFGADVIECTTLEADNLVYDASPIGDLRLTGTLIVEGTAYIGLDAVFGANLDVVGVLTGDGSGLTNLNGSNVATGTVADARIDDAIHRDVENKDVQYIGNTAGTTKLNETTGPYDSGAYLIGVYDGFVNSATTNLQGVLDNFDDAMENGSTISTGTVGDSYIDSAVHRDTENKDVQYVGNTGGTTKLNETTSYTDCGAYLIGAYDHFEYASATDVESVLDSLDAAIGQQARGSIYDRIYVVSPSGDDTKAAGGIGPFKTPSGAWSFVTTTLSPVASSSNPVVIYLVPAVISYSITISDGVYWVGSGIDSTILSGNVGITIAADGNVTGGASNLTVKSNATSLGCLVNGVHYAPAAGIVNVLLDHVVLNSQNDNYDESPQIVSAIEFFSTVNNLTFNLTFKDSIYYGHSSFLFLGHPSVGDRDVICNATVENSIVIAKNDSGDGPEDPHFLILDYCPGTLNIYNSYLSWDMTDSANDDQDCGVIFMDNEDGNDYTGSQYLNIWGSRLHAIHNSLTTASIDPTILAILGKVATNRFTGVIEDCTFLKGTNVPNDLYTNNNHTITYGGSNISTIISGGGSPVVTCLTDGIKKFDSVTVTGTVSAEQVTSTDDGDFTDQVSAARLNINAATADKDSIIAGADDANLFHADASANGVGFGVAAPGGKVEIETDSAYAKTALVVDQNDIDQNGIAIEYPTTGATGYPLHFTLTEDNTGDPNDAGNYTELNGDSAAAPGPMQYVDFSGWSWDCMIKVKVTTGDGDKEIWIPGYTWTPAEE